MNFSFEAIVACIAGAGLFALALSPSLAPSYSSVRAAFVAQDLLEVIEKEPALLRDAYGLGSGDGFAASRLSRFLERVRPAVGAKCISLSANSFAASSSCSHFSRKIIFRRLLFDGRVFFFLEARVSY